MLRGEDSILLGRTCSCGGWAIIFLFSDSWWSLEPRNLKGAVTETRGRLLAPFQEKGERICTILVGMLYCPLLIVVVVVCLSRSDHLRLFAERLFAEEK